jgi:hypothetical protein
MKKWYFILSIILILGGLELYFRHRYPITYITPNIYQYDKQFGYRYIPNCKYYSGKQVVHFNKYGYIGPDWSIKKDSSIFRIAFLGPCELTGALLVNDTVKYNFPTLIQEEFLERKYRVEILNFGIDGGDRSYYNFKLIKQDVLRFNPNLIILLNELPFSAVDYTRETCLGYLLIYPMGSVNSKKNAKDWAIILNRYKPVVYLLNNCHILKALAKYCYHRHKNRLAKFLEYSDQNKIVISDGNTAIRYSVDESIRMIKELNDSLAKRNSKFYLLEYECDEHFSDYYNTKGLPVLSLMCNFTSEKVYPEDSHFNNLGQIELKKQLIKMLLPLIPAQYK